MGKLTLDSSQSSSALQQMANAVENLSNCTRNYLTSLEGEISVNLSGSSVSKFMEQTRIQCNNLATTTQNLSEITAELSRLNQKVTSNTQQVSRGGIG